MPDAGAGYDAETLDLMTTVFSAVWREALGQGVPADQHEAIRARIAAAICAGVDEGEREPERLKERGLLDPIAKTKKKPTT